MSIDTKTNRVIIFDTTLRDGEQSPGTAAFTDRIVSQRNRSRARIASLRSASSRSLRLMGGGGLGRAFLAGALAALRGCLLFPPDARGLEMLAPSSFGQNTVLLHALVEALQHALEAFLL